MDYNGLELLARFELATSSLPRIWGLCPHEVSSQTLPESLVSQQDFLFYYWDYIISLAIR